MQEFLDRVQKAPAHLTSLIKYELHKYASFPVATHDPEFVLAMADHFDPSTRQVRDDDQKVIMTLDSVFFNSIFKGSLAEEVANISQESAQEYYEKHEDKCKKVINIVYLSTARSSLTSRWPKSFHRSDFNKEYNDMVTMLSRVRGLKDSHYFQSWTIYYMNIIRKGAARIDWGEQINDVLCAQLKEVKVTLKFYMTSYLVYAATSMR